MPLSLSLYKAGSFQNPHVMRNSRLRQLHPFFDIEGAEPSFLADRASTFFFKRPQNSAASRVGNGVQETIEIGSGVSHDQEGYQKGRLVIV